MGILTSIKTNYLCADSINPNMRLEKRKRIGIAADQRLYLNLDVADDRAMTLRGELPSQCGL